MAGPSDRVSPLSGTGARLELSELTHSVFEAALDTIRTPMFVVRPDNRVLWMNRRGQAMIASDAEITLVNGRLRGETAAQSGEIDDLVKSMAVGERSRRSRRPIQAKRLSDRAFERSLHLVAISLAGSHPDIQSGLSVLFIGDPDSRRVANPNLLRHLLGLTPAEARIAAGLADGLSINELASDLGVGIGTVRWHVKRAMANTGTRRQGELIRLVLLSPLAQISA